MPRIKAIKVGAILKPNDDTYPDLRVVGGDAGAWVVEEADEFSSGPRLLDPDEAAGIYGVTESPRKADEQKGWDSLATAHLRPILPSKPKTPEEVFAEAAK